MKDGVDIKVAYLEFINRENGFLHHRYDREMLQYEYIRSGDIRAVDEAARMIRSSETGHLSDDPVKNLRYLCVCNITLVTRFAIDGGMDAEKAYNASDLYIRRYDRARTAGELYEIHGEMIRHFVRAVAESKTHLARSRQVARCMDYIHHHLHEQISVGALARLVGLNESYLSALFRRESGVTVTEYVARKRMEAAEHLLKYSDCPLSEIASILHFSSYSHFARTFRKYHGTSPRL